MRFQPRFSVLAALVATGTLNAQQKISVSVGAGGEWITIPERVAQVGIAQGAWGASATLELGSVRTPWLRVIARLAYAPERVAPAAPQILTVGSGPRFLLLTTPYVTVAASLEAEAVRFSAAAYNEAVAYCRPGHGCPAVFLGYIDGWRVGASARPAVQIWPTGTVGLQITPAVRWLAPLGRGGPNGNPTYVSIGAGMVLRF